MNTDFPYTQIRIARPTNHFNEVVAFYKTGLGLKEIGSFSDHEGINGIMLGMPDERYHLEFTDHKNGIPCPPSTNDNLLVFYLSNQTERDKIANRLFGMGYREVEPENPYWKEHGVTIEDPDNWRIVLMGVDRYHDCYLSTIIF